MIQNDLSDKFILAVVAWEHNVSAIKDQSGFKNATRRISKNSYGRQSVVVGTMRSFQAVAACLAFV